MTIRETAPGRTQRTRARLQTAALELFARQGYEATTVAQIAAAAGVTEMTFYRHFGTKDQLLLDDPYDPLMAGAVAAQPPGLPPVIRAVRGIRAAWRAVPIQDTGPVRDRLASEAAIGAELAAGGADPREAAIAAAAVMAALMTALLQWGRDGDGTLSAAIERALDVVEAHHD